MITFVVSAVLMVGTRIVVHKLVNVTRLSAALSIVASIVLIAASIPLSVVLNVIAPTAFVTVIVAAFLSERFSSPLFAKSE